MKEEDGPLFAFFLLGCVAGAIIVCLLLMFGVVHAQEGCGWWLKTKGCFNIQQLLEDEDSVWIPEPCPEERNWWDPPLDTISIDTTYQIWENIRHSGGRLQSFLKETTTKRWTEWDTIWDIHAITDTVAVPPKQMAMKDTVYTDWMYADSIYIFHFGRKFVWRKR